MELSVKNFRCDEAAGLRLRALFERRGFRRVRVNKFEDYALYLENKNFLQSENMITFMDLNGKLLALKPDVTLSVVRSMPKKALPALEKLYYVDEVYRLSREMREYRVHNQVGVELIGRPNPFSNIEAVDLALSSLALISSSFVLDVSHLGFVSGLLEDLPVAARKQALAGIHAKSGHDVAAALDAAGVGDGRRDRILALCGLNGSFLSSLPRAKALVASDAMQEAYDELAQLGGALCHNGFADRLNLDFSVVNDLDYYNGLIFLGYVEGLPRVVLTGGRYDNLMKKMDKECGAVGFAVSLDDLATYLPTGRRYDFDMLVTYPQNCDFKTLLKTAKQLSEQGISVRLESDVSDLSGANFTWEKRCRFDGEALVEEASPC